MAVICFEKGEGDLTSQQEKKRRGEVRTANQLESGCKTTLIDGFYRQETI